MPGIELGTSPPCGCRRNGASVRIEGESFSECFSQAFEMATREGPVFAFETWGRNLDPNRIVVDIVKGSRA